LTRVPDFRIESRPVATYVRVQEAAKLMTEHGISAFDVSAALA
jgi:hypothetical protein